MTARARPPTRRQCERFTFEHNGISYSVTVGYKVRIKYYADGTYEDLGFEPLELFLAGGKSGSAIDAMARDFAVVVSLALQHGVPFATMIDAITRLDNGKAAGPGGRALDEMAVELIMDEIA